MHNSTHDETDLVNEDLWRAWIEKGKRRRNDADRTMKAAAGLIALSIALCGVFYLLV